MSNLTKVFKFFFFKKPVENDIRTFDRVRQNDDCDLRPTSGCKIFETFRKPDLIPDDLYKITNFGHEYEWIITSHEATGHSSN
jgi:hypothetical protein